MLYQFLTDRFTVHSYTKLLTGNSGRVSYCIIMWHTPVHKHRVEGLGSIMLLFFILQKQGEMENGQN